MLLYIPTKIIKVPLISNLHLDMLKICSFNTVGINTKVDQFGNDVYNFQFSENHCKPVRLKDINNC